MPTLTMHPSANCPTIELMIKGQKYLFLVDTGANTTILVPALAKQLKFHKSVSVANFQGECYAGLYTGKFNLLGKTITSIIVSNLEQVGRPISGILGQDLFCQFKQLEFDYVCAVVRFKE